MAYQTIATAVEGSFDKGIRSYTRTYKILTDSTALGPGQVCTLAPDLLYQSWVHGTEVDLWALCKKKSAKPMGETDGGFLWIVTAEYDSEPFEQSQGGDSPSGGPTDNSQTQPDLRPWQIEFGSVKTTKLLTEDVLTGAKVAASNGQPFDPPPEIPAFHPQITITAFKAIGSESLANVSTYTNKVNAGAWLGFADQTVLCTEYKLQSQFEQGNWWWQKTVTLEVNPDGPYNPIKVLDCGTVWRESLGKPPQPILDKSGNPVTQPVPLNGAGAPLNAGAALVYLDFNGYNKVSFAGII